MFELEWIFLMENAYVLEKTMRFKENKEKQREQNTTDERSVILKEVHELKPWLHVSIKSLWQPQGTPPGSRSGNFQPWSTHGSDFQRGIPFVGTWVSALNASSTTECGWASLWPWQYWSQGHNRQARCASRLFGLSRESSYLCGNTGHKHGMCVSAKSTETLIPR